MLSDTRVSDKLYFHGKKVMDAIEEIFIGYIFFAEFNLQMQQNSD